MKKTIYFLTIFISLTLVGSALAGDSNTKKATADAYYDIATGHKYIKNQDETYSEYSKRGKLLRADVPNTKTLLVSGKYVREVTKDHYLVYEKTQNNETAQKILPASNNHPKGWECDQLVSVVPMTGVAEAEAYEPAQ